MLRQENFAQNFNGFFLYLFTTLKRKLHFSSQIVKKAFFVKQVSMGTISLEIIHQEFSQDLKFLRQDLEKLVVNTKNLFTRSEKMSIKSSCVKIIK